MALVDERRTGSAIRLKDIENLKDSLTVGQHVILQEIACEDGRSRYVDFEYIVTGKYKYGFTVRKILNNGSVSPVTGFKNYIDLMVVGYEE